MVSSTELFQHHPNQEKPAIGVAIGGNSKHATLDSDDLRKQLDEIFNRHTGHVFGYTTRAEPPSDIISIIKTYPLITCLSGVKMLLTLPAFIATCDHLYLTADSASMIKQAVSFGSASVNLLPVHFHAKSKLNTFTQQLCKEGYVNCTNKTMQRRPIKYICKSLIKNTLHESIMDSF